MLSESRLLSSLSLLLGLVTFGFVAQQVKWLPWLRLNTSNDPFYLALAILGLLAVGTVFYFSRTLSLAKILEKLLVVFLPVEIAIIFGLAQSRNFHYIFHILMGGYVILAGSLAVFHYLHRHRSVDEKSLNFIGWCRLQGKFALALVTLITLLFFVFGWHRLAEFAAVDEPLWTNGRITKYWHNIEERDWKGTRISDKPGVTVALAAGPGLWFVTPKEYRAISHEGELVRPTSGIEYFYFVFRFPFLIVITLLLPLFYFFLERLIGKHPALAGYTLIGLSPVLIGMSKIINPDSLLWLLAPLALLSYLVSRERRSLGLLLVSGLLMGLALLTKYVSNIVFVFMFGLIFLEWMLRPTLHGEGLARYLRRSFIELGILTFTALSVFYMFFPAVWVKPEKLLTSTLYSQAFEKVAPLFIGILIFLFLDLRWNRARTSAWIMGLGSRFHLGLARSILTLFGLASVVALANVFLGSPWYNFSDLLAAPKTVGDRSDLFGVFLTNFYPLLFGVTPLVLGGLLAGLSFAWQKTKLETIAGRTFLFLALFVLLYFLGGAANGVAMIVRYQIMLFPLAAIMAGIGWLWLWQWLQLLWPTLKTSLAPRFALLGLIIGSIPTLAMTPFPLSYASFLLPRQLHIDIKDMGPGSYEVAQWLNSQPDPTNIVIWTDKDGVCKFFVGRCKRGFGPKSLHPEEPLSFVVVSSGRESRTAKMIQPRLPRDPTVFRYDLYYQRSDPEFAVEVNGRPSHFVKIFRYQPE